MWSPSSVEGYLRFSLHHYALLEVAFFISREKLLEDADFITRQSHLKMQSPSSLHKSLDDAVFIIMAK
jgi:hypothetical protein